MLSSTALQWGAIVVPAVAAVVAAAAAAFVAWRIHVESEKTRDLLVRPYLVFHSLMVPGKPGIEWTVELHNHGQSTAEVLSYEVLLDGRPFAIKDRESA